MSDMVCHRLQNELRRIAEEPTPGITVNLDSMTDMKTLTAQIEGAAGTLYAGESYQLRFSFGNDYPFVAPEVVFVGNIPVHPHIYSNGHICLSILYDEWSPVMGVRSTCLSILSMLSSCTEKKRPPDDFLYVSYSGSRPSKSRWLFHDDSV